MPDFLRNLLAFFDDVGTRRGCAWLASHFDIDIDEQDPNNPTKE